MPNVRNTRNNKCHFVVAHNSHHYVFFVFLNSLWTLRRVAYLPRQCKIVGIVCCFKRTTRVILRCIVEGDLSTGRPFCSERVIQNATTESLGCFGVLQQLLSCTQSSTLGNLLPFTKTFLWMVVVEHRHSGERQKHFLHSLVPDLTKVATVGRVGASLIVPHRFDCMKFFSIFGKAAWCLPHFLLPLLPCCVHDAPAICTYGPTRSCCENSSS